MPTIYFDLYSAYDAVVNLTYANASYFESHANTVADFNNTYNNWTNFVNDTLMAESANIEFSTIISLSYEMMRRATSPVVTTGTFICSDAIVVRSLLNGIVGSYSVVNAPCNGNDWSYFDGNICVNCYITSPNVTLCNNQSSADSIDTSSVLIPFYSDTCTDCYSGTTFDDCSGSPEDAKLSVVFTVLNTVPEVNYIEISSVGNTSLTAEVVSSIPDNFDPDDGNAISVTCGLYLYSTALTNYSKSEILNSGQTQYVWDISTVNRTLVWNFEFLGLTAASQYQLLCFGTDELNTVNSGTVASDVILTECCILIEFSSYPAAFYGTQSSTSTSDSAVAVESAVAANSFSFGMSTATGTALLIHPQVYSIVNTTRRRLDTTTVVAQNISIYPSNVTINGTGAPSRSFVVQGSPGIYQVDLNISFHHADAAAVASNYVSAPVLVEVLDIDAPTPPPELLKSWVSDSGVTFLIQFNNPTDLAATVLVYTGSWPCSTVISFPNVSAYTCSWINSTVLQASNSPGLIATHIPGWTVSLLADTIKAECTSSDSSVCTSYLYASVSSVSVLVPYNPVVPSIVISVPSTIGACDNIRIDATGTVGNAGREWISAVWLFRSVTTGLVNTNITGILNGLGQSVFATPIEIDGTGIEVSTYSITLSLSNYLGKSQSRTVQMSKSASSLTPSAVLYCGSSVTYVASDKIQISGKGSPSLCALDSVLNFTWSIFRVYNDGTLSPALTDVVSLSNTPTVFKLGRFSLTPGNSYQLYMYVASESVNSTLRSAGASARTNIYIQNGAVVAFVQGGTLKSQAINKAGVLDASASYDENSPSNALDFLWSCSVTSPISQYGTDCSSLLDGSSLQNSTVVVLADALVLSWFYKFQVIATATDDSGRQAVEYVTVVGEDPSTPVLDIVIPLGVVKINPAQKFSVKGFMYSADFGLNASWLYSASTASSNTNTNVSSAALSDIAMTGVYREFSVDDTSVVGGINFPLLLFQNVLNVGVSYTFTLTATQMYTGAIAAYSSITLLVNAPPTSGYFTISPEQGTPLSTVFAFAAPDWNDDVTDFPLLFDFAYKLSSSSDELALQYLVVQSYTDSVLPAGLSSYNFSVVGVMRVRDAYDSFSEAFQTVRVVLEDGTDAGALALSYLNSSLPDAFGSGDVTLVSQIINVVGTSLSYSACGLAPNCSLINRNPCECVPQVCYSAIFR